MMNQLPNSFYAASLDEVIEKLYNAAADRQLPSVTVLEQSSDGTIPVKLVVSRSFLLHVYLYCIVLASVLCLICLNTSGVCNLIFITRSYYRKESAASPPRDGTSAIC